MHIDCDFKVSKMAEAENNISKPETPEKAVRPVLFASSLTLSEYSLYLQRLLTGLADESISAALISSDESAAQTLASPTVKVIKHPQIRLPFMSSENRKILIEKLSKFRPTVLHCLCESCFTSVKEISKQTELPYFVSINGIVRHSSHLLLSANKLAGIITPVETIAADVAKNIPKLEERIELIKPGTFVSDTTASFNRPQRTPVVCAACSVREKTDFTRFLNAIKKLAAEGHKFMTIIIGDGQDEKNLRSIMSKLGISKLINIIPRTEPWRSVLSASDIFIEPRQNKYFNLMILEALSVGCAVAGYKGGVNDLIIEDQTARILDKSDEQSIYRCIRGFLDNPSSARELAKKAQDFIRNNHTVSKMVAETIECYKNAQNRYNHT